VAELTDTGERLRRSVIRALSRIHAVLYRISGGRLLGRLAGMPVLLLTTTGRRSGKRRTATLTYFRHGADLVVIGSFGGSNLPPGWWLNLQREPRASVLIGRTTSKVTARPATAEEHDLLWPRVTETHPGYASYQERTARPIPIVLLTPLSTVSGERGCAVGSPRSQDRWARGHRPTASDGPR
jgi:F420H(2)-dependent quinone reductase